MGHDHLHDEHDHFHDEVTPLDVAIDPPAEQLLAALRVHWLADQEALTSLKEQLMVANTTVAFQNQVIEQLKNQLAGGSA